MPNAQEGVAPRLGIEPSRWNHSGLLLRAFDRPIEGQESALAHPVVERVERLDNFVDVRAVARALCQFDHCIAAAAQSRVGVHYATFTGKASMCRPATLIASATIPAPLCSVTSWIIEPVR